MAMQSLLTQMRVGLHLLLYGPLPLLFPVQGQVHFPILSESRAERLLGFDVRAEAWCIAGC